MLVRLSRSVLRVALKREPVGLDMRGSIVVMRLAAVNQLAVLGAFRVLDQEHVAAARALKQESKETRKGTSPPDHCVSRRLWARTRHR